VGIIPGILVNGKRYTPTMGTEEASVVAGASNAAKMAGKRGGFRASVEDIMTTTGQIEVVKIPAEKIEEAKLEIERNEKRLIEMGNEATPNLVAAGGRILSITPRVIETRMGPQLIINFEADCKDAMGAAATSKMAQGMSPEIEKLTGGEVIVMGKVISNLMLGRMVTVDATFDKESLALKKEINGKMVEISGEEMVERICYTSAWGEADQFRATTHNKGIMNGIDAVGLALGQDTRALESAAHSYAAFGRPYTSLSYFEKDANGDLHGHLEVPIPLGLVGGATAINEQVKANIEATGCKNVPELAMLIGSVGLAQNLAALRMLVGEGVTSGHGSLHRKRVEEAEKLKRAR
jgi:hydroxymethylglutaryl-CoA reductase